MLIHGTSIDETKLIKHCIPLREYRQFNKFNENDGISGSQRPQFRNISGHTVAEHERNSSQKSYFLTNRNSNYVFSGPYEK